jgi:hypothetical protein
VTLQRTTSAANRHICGRNNLIASSTKHDVSPAEESVRDVNDVRSVRIDRRLLLYTKVQMCLGSERFSGPAHLVANIHFSN